MRHTAIDEQKNLKHICNEGPDYNCIFSITVMKMRRCPKYAAEDLYCASVHCWKKHAYQLGIAYPAYNSFISLQQPNFKKNYYKPVQMNIYQMSRITNIAKACVLAYVIYRDFFGFYIIIIRRRRRRRIQLKD
jgi:hypothetical protein